ncbi:MAG: hypothetical protein QNJ13_11110 [Paracoccaceae bacterium]|nr:hypothetical protein [Paracoccaceae bacterium]
MTDLRTEAIREEPQAVPPVGTLSCGRAERHAGHRYESAPPRLRWLVFGRRRGPLQAFVTEHRSPFVLFERGIDPASLSEAGYIDPAIGRSLLPRNFRFHPTETDRIDRDLDRAGLAASKMATAAAFRLHIDPAGGTAQIPQTGLIAGEEECAILSSAHPEGART